MLDIPTVKAKLPQMRANRQARQAGTEMTGVNAGSSLGPETPVVGQTAGETSMAPTSTVGNPWMSYGEYFAGKPEAAEASKYSMYHPSTATSGEGMDWGPSGNPYRFGNEYNEYKSGLPLIYQDLINYGISPEMVASGQANSILRGSTFEKIPTDPTEAMNIYGSTRGAAPGTPGGPTVGAPSNTSLTPSRGTGSSHGLSPSVVNKMWR